MKPLPMDMLIRLPREEAIERHFASGNSTHLYRVVVLGAIAVFVHLIGTPVRQQWWHAIGPVLELLFLWGFFLIRRRPVYEARFRRVLVVVLLGQLLLLSLFRPWDDVPPIVILFMIATVFFRLRVDEYLLLYGGYWLTACVHGVAIPLLSGEAPRYDAVIGLTLMAGACLLIALLVTRRRRRLFLAEWSRLRGRHREDLRMREELEAARKIQLQMLPSGESPAEWVDTASLSLPATEVGGDYYDYFRLSESQVAVVIGDVAGHGVTSGILLSGVRSCLHLLHGFRSPVAEVMEKLDDVVRQTTDRRMFMTLLYAVFDTRAKTLTVSSAGHPPLLHHHCESDQIDELDLAALPLGTPLPATFSIETVPYLPGDTFLFHTDGLSELRDQQEEDYRLERLKSTFGRELRTHRTAKEIRDGILRDLWSFKGDTRQRDDITLVVVRPS